MYKYYKKGDYNIMEYNFDSITEFLEYIENTPINDMIWHKYNAISNSSDYMDFYKTKSFDEAVELCRYGYHENFDRFVELKIVLEKYLKTSYRKNQQYNYYVGYVPDVKAYLEGNPLSMLNRQNPKRQHIDIYFNAANLSEVTTEQIFNRGAITLSIVEALENMNFSVGLHVFTMSNVKDQIHYVKLNLKRNNEKLNIQKLFFPLCHPSFLRRLIFRLREQTPDITYFWTDGYGITCDDCTIREVIDLAKNDIVICRPDEMGVHGYNIIDDANSMFDYINEFANEKINLNHIEKNDSEKKYNLRKTYK